MNMDLILIKPVQWFIWRKRRFSVEDKATILALALQPITKGNALVKARKGSRMFEVLITYNEFFRYPDVFKDFIKEPKKLTKWNFWCKKMKYKQEKFEKNFKSKIRLSNSDSLGVYYCKCHSGGYDWQRKKKKNSTSMVTNESWK